MKEEEQKPKPKIEFMTVNVWKCEDLKALIHREIQVHVKDVDLAKRLEHALADEIAYGTGGGGNIAVS